MYSTCTTIDWIGISLHCTDQNKPTKEEKVAGKGKKKKNELIAQKEKRKNKKDSVDTKIAKV